MYEIIKKLKKEKQLWPKILIVLAATIVIAWFYPRPQSNRYIYEQGRPWSYAKLIAPFDIPVHPSEEVIKAAKDSLDSKFVPVYLINQLLVDSIVSELPQLPGTDFKQRLGRMIRDSYAQGVVDLSTKEKIDGGTLPSVRILEVNILSESSTSGFSSPREIYEQFDSSVKDPGLLSYIKNCNLPELLRPNITYSPEESKRHYDQAYMTLTADRGVIQQGQTIIDKGTIITSQDFTNLRTYEELIAKASESDGASSWLLWLGQFLYVLIIIGALFLYLAIYQPDILRDTRAMIFLATLITLFFLITCAMATFSPIGVYLVPMTIVPILVMVFFNGRTALFTSMSATMICAGVTAFPLEFIFLQFAATTTSIYSMRDLTRRSEMLRASIFIAGAYILGYCSLEFLMNGSCEGISLRMLGFLAINAMLTSLAYLLIFLTEKIFGFTSRFTLIEIADTNSPLLRKLSEECPGTFQHSLAVSTLAVDAAKKIGADANLMRAGALYHDIGKLANPAFFTENQNGVNPHDLLPPERSAEIVINHVTDGVAIATKKRLPHEIVDFILQHHGKGKARYFYYQYCQSHPDKQPDDTIFSYPGPNPRTRETSVLMMADAVEAASRSCTEHTPEAIRQLVNKIIDTQLADGLHNESTLEIRDIKKIKEAFAKRLLTIYHSRVVYPAEATNRERPSSESPDTQNQTLQS